MKKISLVTLSMITSVVMFAQNQPQLRTPMAVKPRFGIIGGVNIAKLSLSDNSSSYSPDITSKAMLHGGVVYNIPLSETFRFEPGIVYNGLGSKFSQSVGSVTQNYEYKLHYISLPLRFQFQTTGGFLVEIFPQASYLLKGKQDGPGSATADLKDKDVVRKFDIGAGAGIGYVTRIGLGVGADYYYGLANVWKNSTNGKLHNRAFSVGLRYYFGAYK